MKSGWVDIPTNAMTLNLVSSLGIVENMNSGKSISPKYLPIFLHEFTHHWCFDSPVGGALSLLYHRLDVICGQTKESSFEDAMSEGYELFLRYQTVLRILMPIIEGIALFAEFDALPTTSHSLSIPAKWTAPLFFKEHYNNPITYEALVGPWKDVLVAHRASLEGIGRKRLLLTAPLSGVGRGYYLRGYLLVKKLHQFALERSRLFQDTDFFLTYLRNLIFNDVAFAHLMLAPQSIENDWITEIYNYVRCRLALMWHSDLASKAALLDHLLATKVEDPEQIAESVFVAPDAVNKYGNLFRQLVTSPCDTALEEGCIDEWNLHIALVFRHRNLVRLTSERVQLVVDAARHVWCEQDGDRRYVGTASTEIAFHHGVGRVSLYYLPRFHSLVLLSFYDGELVSVNPVIKDKVFKLDLEAIKYVAMTEWFNVSSGIDKDDNYLNAYSSAQDLFNLLEEELERAYTELIMIEMPEDLRVVCRTSMARTGFHKILKKDNYLIDGLATISALHSAGLTPAEIQDYFKNRELDIDFLIRQLLSIQKETGFPILQMEQDDGSPTPLLASCLV
jgi:hypothetical protein